MSDSSDEGEPFRLRDYSDDSEDERPNKKRRTMQSAPLRAKGMGFVSATSYGVDEEDEAEDRDDERPTMGGFGLGFGGKQTSFNIGEYNDGAPDRSPSPERDSGSQTPNTGGRGPSAFSVNGKVQKNSFAARMMAKMGHVEGQGLGKSAQGISAPIQAQLLQSRAGLGHGSAPEKPQKVKRERHSQTSTPGASTPRLKAAPKKKYEVTAIESRGLHIPEAMKSMIVDATGAETKTISSLSGFSTPTSEIPPVSEATKASARIKMQLQAYADAWDATQEQETRLDLEEEQLQSAVELYIIEEQKFQDIISTFERVSMDDSGQPRTWDQTVVNLQTIQDRFAEDIEDLDLPELSLACLETAFRRELVEWDTLAQPDHFVLSFQSLGALLELEKATEFRHRRRTTPFETLLLSHWFPHIRTALKDWSVYDPDSAVNLVQTWNIIIPPWLLYKVLHELILPKLIEAVRRFPKVVESNSLNSDKLKHKNGGTTSSKNRRAPELHSWLFDWWEMLSADDLALERFSELKTLVKNKVESSSWSMWKPLLGSKRKPAIPAELQDQKTTTALPTASTSTTVTAMDDISFKDIVEEWCTENNLLLRTTGRADTFGRPLYRLQDAERRGKGMLVYLADDVVFGEDGHPFGLDDSLVRQATGR